MKTKLTMLNGDEHIIDGRPEDLMKVDNGIGMSYRMMIEVSPGKEVDMADVVMMQGIKE